MITSYFSKKQQAVKPKAVPKPTSSNVKDDQDDQDFIDFFYNIAKYPDFKSGKLNSRRVAVFGKAYGWKNDVTFGVDKLPSSFRKWCAAHRVTNYNSFSVNVYNESKHKIDWHCDEINQLSDGEVFSVSFAKNAADRGKVLAKLEFKYKKKGVDEEVIKSEELRHGTIVRFDAIKHKKKGCLRRVPKTLCPRVNITMRRLK